MAKSEQTKHCGKCGTKGHSIRTCKWMVKVSRERGAEVAKNLAAVSQ